MLRQIEVGIANRKAPPRKPARKLRSLTQTYYRWRKEFGGLKLISETNEGAGAGEREAEAFGGGNCLWRSKFWRLWLGNF